MKENKKGGRRAYLRDFKRDLTGGYTYTGSHMTYAADNRIPFCTWFWRLVLWNVLSVAAAAVSGFLPIEGLKNCFYIILPLVFELAMAFWALFGVISSGGKEKLRVYVYEKTFRPLAVKNTVSLACAVLGAGGCVVFSLLHDNGEVYKTVLYVLLRCIGAALSFLSVRDVKNARFAESSTKVNPD